VNKALLILVGLVISPITLSASISNPYVVDEKPQVIFGDSEEMDGHYGLENYSADYVDGYLRIRFTYTHAGCCLSTTTLFMYVTTDDPRTTTSPEVVFLQSILAFMGPFANGGAESDWYNFSFQFTDYGYLVEIYRSDGRLRYGFGRIIPGLSASDWVAFATLPNDAPITRSVAFTPKPITNILKKIPVIIVPGIMSSYLDDSNNFEIWPNLTAMVFPGKDVYLEKLILNVDGSSSESIRETSIIRGIEGNDFFEGLFLNLKDPIEFPYDWRLGIDSLSSKLKEKIDKIKIERSVGKVNLVAHSMGGLLVKKYLENFGGDSINKFIDIGTPHTGSPKAFKILNYGDDMGFKPLGVSILNSEKVKEISQNMPAIYQLLPSQEYFSSSDNDYRYYVFNAANGEDRLTFEQTGNYLKDLGRNGVLIDRADALHEEIDNLNPADYGVDAYNIVGCGTPTVGQFFILEEGEHPVYNIRMINGDGTVPLRSAEAMQSSKTYYARNARHSLMPSTQGVKELVTGILATSTEFDISPFSNLSNTSDGCSIPNGKLVSFHSPIELHVYDNAGHHSGPNSNGDVENGIEGVVYEVLEDNKFAYLPDGVEYEISGTPTGHGTFDVRIQSVENGEVVALSYWDELPVANTNFRISEETPTSILSKPASAVLFGDEAIDLNKPSTEINIKGNEKSPGSYISSVHVTLSPIDDSSGILKTEYSLDGGQTWLRYNEPIHINDRGGVELMYKSTDRAGNVEVTKSKIINIIWPGNSGKR
jgi:pimeloyl-ACP methyl ester carboxylesterase